MLVANSHPNLLNADQSLIVVIDMQDALLRAMRDAERVTTNTRLLIQGATILRIPIVTTTQNADKLGSLALPLRAVLPNAQPPYDKMTFSCLSCVPFASEIKRSGRKQIVICGIEAHICVSQTAHELVAAGYQVHLVVDAISARTDTNIHYGIEKMKQSGILVMTTEMALYELLKQAGTPEFREVLKLVR